MTVVSYDEETGETVFDDEFNFYHFGIYDTKADYNGLDMRGEVAILTRNVIIEGVDQDGWGGQVLTTDIFEATGNFRYGLTVLDSVEIRNCSQRDTDRAAVRFELAHN